MTDGGWIPSSLRLRPREVSAPGEPDGDPFLLYAGGPLPYRGYVARLESGDKVLPPEIALLIEPNEPPASAGRAVAGNPLIEETWREATRAHGSVQSPFVASAETRVDPPPDCNPPLAWCRLKQVYLTPLCPQCLAPMATCRDESLLRRSGLPSYARTLSRFLHCPACASDPGRPPVFYTWSLRPPEGLAQGVRLRRRSELYRDLAPRLHTGAPEVRHACFHCDRREICYPAGRTLEDPIPAEELLFPLAYYDHRALALEFLPFPFEEAAALLGGASAEEGGEGASSGALATLARAGEQYFFEGDPSGLFALEAFYLKLSAFAGLVQGAWDLMRSAGRPHLALSPSRIRGGLLPAGSFLPARWGITLKIADLLTVSPRLDLGEPGAPIWAFPPSPPHAFLPEGMSRPQNEVLSMRTAVRNLELQPEGSRDGRRAHLEAELTSDLYREGEHGEHDPVQIVLQIPAAERIAFSGRRAARLPGGFVFQGTSAPLAGPAAGALDPSRLPASLNGEVTIVHAFGAPADILSLGLLLLRLLLVNDRQEAARLNREALDRAGAALSQAALEHPEQAPPVREILARESIACSPAQVLHREADRNAAAHAIPDALWDEALLLAFRMATNAPGFSLCARQDDYPLEDPAAPLRRCREEIAMLVDRSRGALIGSHGRNVVLQEVCDDFLSDIQEAASGPRAAPEESELEKTIVARARKVRS